MISDPVALQHIINNRSFIRAPSQLQMGKLVFGERSVYCAEGKDFVMCPEETLTFYAQARTTVDFVQPSAQDSHRMWFEAFCLFFPMWLNVYWFLLFLDEFTPDTTPTDRARMGPSLLFRSSRIG